MYSWHKPYYCISFPGLPLELPKSFSPSKRGLWDLLWRPEPSLLSSLELTRESVWLFSNSWPPDSSSSPVSKIFHIALYATHTTFLIVVLRRQSCEINGRGNDFSNWFVLILNFSLALQDLWNWTVAPWGESTKTTFWLPKLVWMCLPWKCPKTSMMIISRWGKSRQIEELSLNTCILTEIFLKMMNLCFRKCRLTPKWS